MAGFVVMAGVCAVLAAPPQGKGGGGAGNEPVFITFTDVPGSPEMDRPAPTCG